MKKLASMTLALLLVAAMVFAVPFTADAAKVEIPAKPTISVNGGSFVGSKKVTLKSKTKGAKIYYSIGKKPTTKSKSVKNGGTVTLKKSGKLYAMAVKGGKKSKILTSKKFTITKKPATPKLSVNGGTFSKTKSVKLTCSTKDAKIYYKLGSAPTTKDKYVKSGKSVKVSKSGKLYVMAVAAGKKSSVVTSNKFTIKSSSTTYTPPSSLNKKTKAEQLAYFNKAANRVRTEKPGFTRTETLKIENLTVDGLGWLGAVVNPIVNQVKNQLMKGEPVTKTYAKGTNNRGEFFADNTNASHLTTSDISSITSAKSGSGWKITVKIKTEKNPDKKKSANGHIYAIASKEEVFNEITSISSAIKADISKAELQYTDGYAWIVVDANGKITSAESGFKVNATAKNVEISSAKGLTVKAPQTTKRSYKSFKW